MLKKQAFSLIELSIVILIIGILVAGVTQSSRLINQMRISTARSLTASSPVTSISGLVSWWEPTSEKSFDEAEASDNSTISTWYDTSPVSLSKNNLVQANAAKKPIYVANALNGLPSLKFNGSSTYFATPSFAPDLNTTKFSVFVVSQTFSAPPTYGMIYCSRGWVIGWNIYSVYSGSSSYLNVMIGDSVNWYGGSSPNISYNKSDLVAITFNSTTAKVFYNGTLSTSFAATNRPSTSNLTTVGSGFCEGTENNFFKGLISEIIIFNRDLKDEERIDIEKYLAKKWNLKIS